MDYTPFTMKFISNRQIKVLLKEINHIAMHKNLTNY